MVGSSKLVIGAVLALLGLSAHAAGTFNHKTATGTSTIYWSGFGNAIAITPNEGWLPAVVAGPGNTPVIKQKLPLPINNKDVVIDVQAKVIKNPEFAKSVLKFGKVLPVVSNVIAAAELVDFLKDTFSSESLTLKNNSGQLEADIINKSIQETDFSAYSVRDFPQRFSSPIAACNDAAARTSRVSAGANATHCLAVDNGSTYSWAFVDKVSFCPDGWIRVSTGCRIESASTRAVTEPEIEEAIKSSPNWPASSAPLIRKMLEQPTIEVPVDPASTATSGPSSIPGETKKTTEQVRLQPGTNVEAPPSATTATDPGTKTTTSTQTTKIVYQGDTVTYNTTNNNSTTNITNNTTNTTTTTNEKTEETQNKEEPPDFCKTNPESIACRSLGTLEPLPVPNVDKLLEIKRNEGWGPSNGTCPAPRSVILQNGLTLEMPFDHACQFADGIRPVVIALAWLSATFSFMGIGRKS